MYAVSRLLFFFFNDTATTEIYTLSLHDALPISRDRGPAVRGVRLGCGRRLGGGALDRGRVAADHCQRDRKSTRLNSSHANISYAVFCLKKKKDSGTGRPGSCTAIKSSSAGLLGR